jgi:hypothetical protein
MPAPINTGVENNDLEEGVDDWLNGTTPGVTTEHCSAVWPWPTRVALAHRSFDIGRTAERLNCSDFKAKKPGSSYYFFQSGEKRNTF